MRLYETTIVIDSFLKSEDMQNLVNKIQNFLKNNGGEISKIEEWGKKRLAYEINRKQYGNYVHILFEGPSSLPQLLEREYRLEESILRYLTVQTNPKILTIKEKEKVRTPNKHIEPSIDYSIQESIQESITDDDLSIDEDGDLSKGEIEDKETR